MIFLTGSNGFVGRNVLAYFKGKISVIESDRNCSNFKKENSVIFHFAGKAHDLKNEINFDEYYSVNTELTKKVFDLFLSSNAKVFITLSSVKAVADDFQGILTEDIKSNPKTHYGKSKKFAEEYIFSKEIPFGKHVYVLRPCLIHGPGNKGNLNELYNYITKGLPWPLGAFENERSYLSIQNLCFILEQLISRDDIPSGIYNVSDNDPISTNRLIELISETKNIRKWIIKVNKNLIWLIANIGDFLGLPLNTEKLSKLTNSYIVSNEKILKHLKKELPLNSVEGMIKTFESF